MRGPYIGVSSILGASYAFPSGLDSDDWTSYERQWCSCAAIVTHGAPVHQRIEQFSSAARLGPTGAGPAWAQLHERGEDLLGDPEAAEVALAVDRGQRRVG